MRSLQNNGIDADSRASGTQKHCESLPGKQVSREMDAAIRRLIPHERISQWQLLDLFDRRASYASITAWRFGWRRAPQWAADLIRSKLAARAADDIAAGQALKPPIGKGWNKGAKTLAAWRERKARERDEKEKAAHDIPRT